MLGSEPDQLMLICMLCSFAYYYSGTFVCGANLHFIIQAHLNTTVHSIVILVEFQFSKFSNLRKKFKYMTVNWMHVPIGRMVSKPKIRGCSNVRIGL